MHAYKPLQIIDGREANWLKKAKEAGNTKRNFVAILSSTRDLDRLCRVLKCSDKKPERLGRWGVHGLAEVLEPAAYSLLVQIYERTAVYLIEQIYLDVNRPPHTKPVMLYCEVRGIISEHKSVHDAGSALLDYLDSFKRARIFPLAGIYAFKKNRWQRIKKLTGAVND